MLGACIAETAQAGPPRRGPASVADLYGDVGGSVVTISTMGRQTPAVPGATEARVKGLGSGVLVSRDGLVLTAAHVVQTADEIRVDFDGGEAIAARVVRSNPAADVAVLELERVPAEAKVATLGDSDAMRVGDPVFVVGAPLGIPQTLTAGHISARRQPETLATLSDAELFQTDASINQGNSGGPMFNMRGEVVGIVSHMITVTGGDQGLGFSVTSNALRKLLEEPGTVWSGLGLLRLSGELARLLNVPQPEGLLVQAVARDSIGDRLGLRGGSVRAEIAGYPLDIGGDVILSVGGVVVGSSPDERDRIRAYVSSLETGDLLELEVLRGGERRTLKTAVSAEDLGR